MIKFVVDLRGVKELDKVLVALKNYLEDLTPQAKKIQEQLPVLMKRRFSTLGHGIQLNAAWAKRKGHARVGVYTGAMRNALYGGAGNINELVMLKTGFKITYGIDERSFPRRYPLSFSRWLREDHGEELVALDDFQAERNVAADFFEDVTRGIDRIMRQF